MNQVFARAVAQGVNIIDRLRRLGRGRLSDSEPWIECRPNSMRIGRRQILTSSQSAERASIAAITAKYQGIRLGHAGRRRRACLFDRPSWQAGFPAPFIKRSFPDVAFNADPNSGQNAWIHLDMGNSRLGPDRWNFDRGSAMGGISRSGRRAARADKPGLGYLNPMIYPHVS